MDETRLSRQSENEKGKTFKIVLTILIAVVVIGGGFFVYKALTGSNDSGKDQESTPTPSAIPTEEPKKESNIKIIDVNSKTRPYAIMINCHNAAFPQSGLQDAYIVYEIMVEYGITRMMALFKDVDFNKVGSVRSARNQYLAYVWENDAIYFHAGGSAEAVERMAKEKVDNISVDGKYGQRDMELAKKRAWEHTLFTKSDSIKQAIKNYGVKETTDVKNLLTYSAEELDLSKYKTTKADKVTIKYSSYRTSGYDYDETSKTYLRNIGSKKNVDLVTGKQYQVKNIIVYGVKYSSYTDHGYSGYQRLSNTGTGEGYYITDGVALPITWEKKDEKSQTVYKVKETGEELVVNDGNTYIQIYPSNGGKLTIS